MTLREPLKYQSSKSHFKMKKKKRCSFPSAPLPHLFLIFLFFLTCTRLHVAARLRMMKCASTCLRASGRWLGHKLKDFQSASTRKEARDPTAKLLTLPCTAAQKNKQKTRCTLYSRCTHTHTSRMKCHTIKWQVYWCNSALAPRD